MKYVNDVILNFHKNYYDFYEWEENDNFLYVKKIPIFKVSKKDLNLFKTCKVFVDLNFINSIKDKCLIYTNKDVNIVNYACIFMDDYSLVSILFNSKGISVKKSSLQVDEELDVLEKYSKLNKIDLDIKVIGKDVINNFTRKELKKIKYINRELDNIYNNLNFDKLKYIYFECFNVNSNDFNYMIKEVYNYVNVNLKKIYDLLYLTNSLQNK